VEVFDRASTRDTPESESYITTDGQSASLSWNKAPIWGLRPDLDYCQTFEGFLMWGVLSEERTGLSFAIATGPRQRSLSRVRVSWDSRPYLLSQIRDFPFRRLLRLAGSRWRYSTPPPHGRTLIYTCPDYNISARTAYKTPFPIIVISNCCLINMLIWETVTQ
jgi:hypothetical protein